LASNHWQMSKGILVQDIDAWMAAIAIACVPFSGMFGYTNPEGIGGD
jgi:hypothetical protein